MLTNLRTFLKSQIFRWLMVGGTTVLIDTVVFTILFNQLNQVILSNFSSVMLSTSYNYFMHHRVTFKSKEKHKNSSFKYLVTLLIFWCFNTICVKLFITFLFAPFASKLLAALIQAPISYLILNKKVFKSNI